MKTYKLILTGVTALMVSLCAQSCLFEQEDTFDKASSLRLQETMDKTSEILRSAPKGWYMELYPEGTQAYGGYVFTLEFKDNQVTIHTELDDPDYSETTYWRMTNDSGPVLTFDTYNSLIHYFATPSSSSYEAWGGEFEFLVMEASSSEVRLRGTRTGNRIMLRPLEVDAEEYIAKVQAVDESLILTGLSGKVNGHDVKGVIDTDFRQIDFTVPKAALPTKAEEASTDTTLTLAYCLTGNGLRLYSPLEIEDATLTTFILNEDSSLSSADVPGASFDAVFPEGWRSFDSYAGNYTFQYYNYYNGSYNLISIPVTLTPMADRSGFIMSGINPQFDMVVKYKKSYGVLNFTSQAVGKYGNNVAWACAWSIVDGGTLTWNESAGVQTVWNGDESSPEYIWVNNGDTTYNIDSMLLWQLKSTGTSAGVLADSAWYFTGAQGSNGCRLYYLTGRSSLGLAPCRFTKNAN